MEHIGCKEWIERQDDGTILHCATNLFMRQDGSAHEVYSDSDGLCIIQVFSRGTWNSDGYPIRAA